MRNKKVVYNGIEYESRQDCCLSLGLNYYAVYSYIVRYNLIFDEAGINSYIQYLSDKCIVYDNKVYSSFTDCCKALGLCASRVKSYKKSHNIESNYEALLVYIDKSSKGDINGHKVVYNGKVYTSKKECYKSFGVSKDLVRKLMKEGYDFCDAMDIILDRKNRIKELYINGVVYKSVHDCCKSLKLDQSKVSNFSRDNNLSIEDAVLEFLGRKRSSIVYNDKTYKSIRQLCEDYDVSIFSFYNSYSGSVSERMNALLRDKSIRECEYDGVIYNNLKECCNVLGVVYGSVCAYKSNNAIESNSEAIKGYMQSISNGTIINNRIKKIEYNGIIYEHKTALANAFGLDGNNILRVSGKYNVDFIDVLDWHRLNRGFNLPKIKAFSSSGIFDCRCKKCGREFLFTRDLAFKHIEECVNE